MLVAVTLSDRALEEIPHAYSSPRIVEEDDKEKEEGMPGQGTRGLNCDDAVTVT